MRKYINLFLIFITTSLLAIAPVATAEETGILFDLTPKEFNQRFISAIKSAGLPQPSNPPGDITKREYNSTYEWKLSPLFELNASVSNETNKLRSAQLSTMGDGTLESGKLSMAMAATFIAAARGSDFDQSQKEAAANIALQLIQKLTERTNQFIEVSIDDGQFLYSADQEKAAGTWFTIEPSEE